MSTHLRRHNPDIIVISPNDKHTTENNEPAASTSSITIESALKSELSPNSTRAQAITRSIGVFMSMDLRPYSIVDNEGFRRLINTLEPKYQIPSCQHFSTKVLPELYSEVKYKVCAELAKANSFALTTDSWTSCATESYITVTVHFIKDDWSIENYVLQTRPLHESHTEKNIASALNKAVEEWKLERPGVSIACVTENANDIYTAIRNTNLIPHIACFADTVNLASQRALDIHEVSRLCKRVYKIVTFFRNSTTVTMKLLTKQKLLQLPQNELLPNVDTRWNSTYDMLVRFLEQQPAISAELTSKDIMNNEKRIHTLSELDLLKVEEIVKVLKPMKTITTVLCSEGHPSISMILQLKHIIIKSMTVNEADCKFVSNIKNVIRQDINKRYTNKNVEAFLLESSALDPRFHSLSQEDSETRLKTYASLAQKATLLCQATSKANIVIKTDVMVKENQEVRHPESDPIDCEQNLTGVNKTGEPPAKKQAMDDLFGDIFVNKVEPHKSKLLLAEEEVTRYISEPNIPPTADPLEWWQRKERLYPLLSKLVKTYLAIPATSIASERIFSTAGDIVDAQRTLLSGEHVDQMVFLKKNMK